MNMKKKLSLVAFLILYTSFLKSAPSFAVTNEGRIIMEKIKNAFFQVDGQQKVAYFGGSTDIEHPFLMTGFKKLYIIDMKKNIDEHLKKRMHEFFPIEQVDCNSSQRSNIDVFNCNAGDYSVKYYKTGYDNFTQTFNNSEEFQFDVIFDKASWLKAENIGAILNQLRIGGYWIGDYNLSLDERLLAFAGLQNKTKMLDLQLEKKEERKFGIYKKLNTFDPRKLDIIMKLHAECVGLFGNQPSDSEVSEGFYFNEGISLVNNYKDFLEEQNDFGVYFSLKAGLNYLNSLNSEQDMLNDEDQRQLKELLISTWKNRSGIIFGLYFDYMKRERLQ